MLLLHSLIPCFAAYQRVSRLYVGMVPTHPFSLNNSSELLNAAVLAFSSTQPTL